MAAAFINLSPPTPSRLVILHHKQISILVLSSSSSSSSPSSSHPITHHHHIHNTSNSSSTATAKRCCCCCSSMMQMQMQMKSSSSVQTPSSPPPGGVGLTNYQLQTPTPRKDDDDDDFYVNLGLAVRTLRQDLPLLFSRDLNYHIYRDDITFLDPLNKFTGIHNYKLIFWALRFHSRFLFKRISLEVFRVWQPSQNLILIRWNLTGAPRLPWDWVWDSHFQGTSRYKVDRRGKIYEHKVDNLAFNFPQQLKPAAASFLDLVAAPASPNLTSSYSASWLEFYRETLDHHQASLVQVIYRV